MIKVEESTPPGGWVVIAKTKEQLVPCIFRDKKFFRINSFVNGLLECSKRPEKVIEWDYFINISRFEEMQEEVEKIELKMLKCLMLKYKEKLVNE
jgi:hypothetical protein